MNNRWWILVLLLAAALILGGFALYDGMFPVAEPLSCPEAQEVEAVYLNGIDGAIVSEDILQAISAAEPTRLWSINEFPAVEEYYTLTLITAKREYRYYLYEEGSQVYLESPYEGVYQIDAQLLATVAAYVSE